MTHRPNQIPLGCFYEFGGTYAVWKFLVALAGRSCIRMARLYCLGSLLVEIASCITWPQLSSMAKAQISHCMHHPKLCKNSHCLYFMLWFGTIDPKAS